MVKRLLRRHGVILYFIQVHWVLKSLITSPESLSIFLKLSLLSKKSSPMVTHMPPTDQSTLTLKHTGKSLNTVNWKEWKTLKLKRKKRMKKEKRETSKTSLSGKPLNLNNPNGPHLGDKEDPDGISNALQWQYQFLVKKWTSIQEVLTWFSHTTKTSSPKQKPTTTKLNGQITFCMWVICTSRIWKCQSLLRTSFLSRRCSSIVQQESSSFTFSCTGMMWSWTTTQRIHWKNRLKKITDTRTFSTRWRLRFGTKSFQLHKSQQLKILSSTSSSNVQETPSMRPFVTISTHLKSLLKSTNWSRRLIFTLIQNQSRFLC